MDKIIVLTITELIGTDTLYAVWTIPCEDEEVAIQYAKSLCEKEGYVYEDKWSNWIEIDDYARIRRMQLKRKTEIGPDKTININISEETILNKSNLDLFLEQ